MNETDDLPIEFMQSFLKMSVEERALILIGAEKQASGEMSETRCVYRL
jgi:hypothetical protein